MHVNCWPLRIRHGGFVRKADFFDNTAFGVSNAEAATMDPQQRLLLEQILAAHYASLHRTLLRGSLTGVFVGIISADFGQLLASSPAAILCTQPRIGPIHCVWKAFRVLDFMVLVCHMIQRAHLL